MDLDRVGIIGCGAIGSLYAAHLSRKAEVWAFVRREEHARVLNEQGLTVSGSNSFEADLNATTDPAEFPSCDLGIVSTKATQTKTAFPPVGDKFSGGAVYSSENGLGAEEIIFDNTDGYVIRGNTFMSGTRHTDTHVEYELVEASWLGPYEPSETPFEWVESAADLINESGLEAEALRDARPAQWAKIIFNASVNSVSALTGLPHSPHFAQTNDFGDLGHLLEDLVDEGRNVANELGIELDHDPWEMNKKGAQTNHPTSMLQDVRNQYETENEFLSGAIARKAREAGTKAPLHESIYRLINGVEAGWEWDRHENE